ncbi:DUF3710 domain-containing protein [Microtetraspora malaysiensis]|uniref:DUF3710 domain-containing protein n=1 Tax=Microtetraspora malaysiensis TaxID=161358 RepID=UPI003D8B885C
MNDVFGRRRRAEEETAQAVPERELAAPARESGPWDADEGYPESERVDLGGLLLPVGPGFEVQLTVSGDSIVGAVVLVEESALQVQAFAAPRRSGIWDEVRAELAREVAALGGSTEEREGPFGTELAARVPAEGQEPQPVRYIGVDGPRWLLRAALSGRAARDADAAATLEGVVRGIVVVRGDEPMAPREPIELRLPSEARHALEQEPPDEEFRPFERGPEISEIR